MAKEKFELKKCWQDERIGQVINKEAASVDKATFMATHTPLNKLIYEQVPQQVSDTSENGLLKELQRCANENSHAFVIVQGIPGTGKSHLIRWLKERYTAEGEQKECVLFIERAQCSLNSTLEQIITSGAFDNESMHQQLEKLKGARIALSREALADTLLDQLRVGANELQQVEKPRWLRHNNKLTAFLLDLTVRRELLKTGGPIDRLVRFLTKGEGIRANEIPRFEESDFDFKAEVRGEIRGYEDALDVVSLLQGDEAREEREELAHYLNHLISYAIGHASALTSDDFKAIFYDLRRHLRKQNLHLALFVEDITALTGIDLGLLDVLATQHTGEKNQEFCRIISIIGITNSYFTDHFPDHMKDRVTHSLTLNAKNASISDTEFLSDSRSTADMAARYLNAIRLGQLELENWQREGGRTEEMPNACDSCPVKEACHSTFGFQRITTETERELFIGLYPFNEKAIWTLYLHIQTSSNKRTPRTLLYNVLYYILQSHGKKVEFKQFPPAPADLGWEFTTFSLAKPLQRNLIAIQGGIDAKRIETLVILWGDGTIDSYQEGEVTFVGDLPTQAFSAFGIQSIAGERLNEASLAIHEHMALSARQGQVSIPAYTSQIEDSTISMSGYPSTSPIAVHLLKEKPPSKFRDDITGWLNGGKLRYYEDYNELLAPLMRFFIDWDLYGISNTQVNEMLRGRRRICIEDQVGKMNTTYYITFQRSTEMADVLLALVEMKEQNQSLEADVLSAHMSNLSIWLHQHEEEIVRFVQQPNHQSPDALPLTNVLIIDCLLLACLKGALKASYSSPQKLYLDLIDFCASTTASSWQEFRQNVAKVRSSGWASVVNKITPQIADNVCSILLSMLNCPQGESTSVLFVDAAAALDIIEEFEQGNWQLPDTGCIGDPAHKIWQDAQSIYSILQNYFAKALEEEYTALHSLVENIENFLGENSAEEVFQAIKKMIEMLAESNRGTNFTWKSTLSHTRLNTLLKKLHAILEGQSTARLALQLSQAGPQITIAYEYLDYFTSFVKEATEKKLSIMTRLSTLREQGGDKISQAQDQAYQLYQEIATVLSMPEAKEEVG